MCQSRIITETLLNQTLELEFIETTLGFGRMENLKMIG